MAELEPEFDIRVWRYTYTAGDGSGTILLSSPQQLGGENSDTLVLRQVNSDAENKVWVQEQASKLIKKTRQAGQPLMDDAHGVIARDGHTKTIPKDGEQATDYTYCRGDQVWVERRLVPTHDIEEYENKIPVVDLESSTVFEIPFNYISFVPQLVKKDNDGEHHAVAAGPILDTFHNRRKTRSQIYFKWLANEPDKVSYVWLDMKNRVDLEELNGYVRIEDRNQKQEAFRNQWQALTKKLAWLGLLFGDEIIEGATSPPDSSSDSEDDDLAIKWSTSLSAQKNGCNLDPCPAFNNPDLDLVASYVGGYSWMEHYHVQDDDFDECSRGAEHKGHCVLRDNRTRCAYATDQVRHTCCKLRMNPILPGPYGDPDDITLPLWETTASDIYFFDASKNVQTRTELEDQDDIPPEIEQLRTQMLATKAATQQIPLGTVDVSMANTSSEQVRSATQPGKSGSTLRNLPLGNEIKPAENSCKRANPYASETPAPGRGPARNVRR
ncbi:hypothetical protein AK830_g6102 [Neonectria ditissima]|uniref:Uncharacterized protein n=1 Tax=Neonectria ditissima TaxID=78410 RepID=A0A0P7BHL3_9HYPO|nr:hypothetical protein AK830_g6102 [Neonectria ditissima]